MNEVTLYDAWNRPVQKNILSEEIARPGMTGVRSLWNYSHVTGGLTPQRLGALLRDAAEGNADAYLTLAEEMEEKDLHYASVLGTRKRAVARLPIVIEAASDDPADIKLADEVRELFKRRGAKGMIENCLDALGKGFSAVEIIWDKSKTPWQPARFEWRDPRFFMYDRDTHSELRLKDEADLMCGIPLPPYKFIVHTPRIKSGIPIRGGLARLAAWTYCFKNFAVKDWVAFCEVFGMPLRLGKYRPGETEDNINILKGAVANLGSDAAAVIPEGMMIEFVDGVKGTGGESLFERIADWFDSQLSKGILGQTMTADNGSSQSQATVHNEVRGDICDADAEQLAETLERDLVIPYIDLNHGTQANYPTVCLREPEQADIPVMTDALSKLVPLGLRVEMSEVRDRLGFSDPGKDAECLGSGGGAGGNGSDGSDVTAVNSERARTNDYLPLHNAAADSVMTQWIEQLRGVLASSADLAEMQSSILDAFPGLPVEEMARILAEESIRANMAGRLDVKNGL